jgi:hypothetical protein
MSIRISCLQSTKTWILPWSLLINESCERARCPKGLAQPRLLRHFPLKSLNSILRGGRLDMLSRVHSRFCSLPIFCALSTHQKNTSTRHTMANRRCHPRRLSVVPFSRRLLRLRQQEHVGRVINGDGGSAVSCNHVYGPPFGLSGAGDLSITITTGQRN